MMRKDVPAGYEEKIIGYPSTFPPRECSIGVYGVFMSPLGWWLAAFVWAYALAFFVVNDFVKVALCKVANNIARAWQ